MKVLDLYCGAGGSSVGFANAGHDVTGVDFKPQPNYPCTLIQADVFDVDWSGYDLVIAGPPCQGYTRVASLGRARNQGKYPQHPDLLNATRRRLRELDCMWVIENVEGAPLIDPVTLCGCMFAQLRVYRKRLFEANFYMEQPDHGPHNDSTPSAGNGVSPKGYICVCGSGGVRGMNSRQILAYWSYAMDIHWMTRAELSQAIPPAFTQWIAKYAQTHLERGRANDV